MYLDLHVGNLAEPLTGRYWDRQAIQGALSLRLRLYREAGLRPADRVFLLHGNQLEFFVDLLAVWKLGGCVVPVDPRLTPLEIETLARAARPTLAIFRGKLDAAIVSSLTPLGVKVLETPGDPGSVPGENGKEPAPSESFLLDQDALILFTSGTTGNPKGVVHTHRSLRARWMGLHAHLGLDRFQRTLCLLPTHFGHGLICNCLYPWLGGRDLFILPPFRPEVILQLGSILDEHEITFMSSVPSVWRLALKSAKAPRNGRLQSVFCGSAPLTAFLWREVQEWTGTPDVRNSYGITETGSWLAGAGSASSFEPEDGFIGEGWGTVIKILKTDSTELPLDQVEPCAAGESGLIWVNTPALMKGYLDRPDLTRAVVREGWFLTGDIGYLDDRGLLYINGRVREEINKGGMKIQPGDIDAVVERFEGVADVCAFGFDDNLYGQNVGMAVVLSETSEERLRRLYQWVKKNLAEYKIPVRWYVLEAIPRTSRGKVNRENVARECAKQSPMDLHKLFV